MPPDSRTYPFPAALPSGAQLKAYTIERVLGQSEFGIVYLARHAQLGLRAAIKEYLPTELAVRRAGTVAPRNPQCRARFEEGLGHFLKEAERLVQFDDLPSIVSCRDLFRERGTAYLVMEFVDGLTLSELLHRRERQGNPFTEDELAAVILPLLEGLQRVHDAGVVHRDINPSNIVIRENDERPVLIDFGAAKHMVSEATKSMAPYSDGYAAMEQVGDGDIGPWTDMYGMGAVMWRIVASGCKPRIRVNPVKVQTRAMAVLSGGEDPLPAAHSIGSGRFSPHVLNAIDRCLALNAKDRIRTARELIVRIRPFAPESEEPAVTRQSAPVRGATPRRDAPWQASERAVGSSGNSRPPWLRWTAILLVVALASALATAMLTRERGRDAGALGTRQDTVAARSPLPQTASPIQREEPRTPGERIATETAAPRNGARIGPMPVGGAQEALPDLHGLEIRPEQRCSPYDRNDYRYAASLEQRIVARQGGVHSPYERRYFNSTGETYVSRVVSPSEAHDSGMCSRDAAARRAFASDLLNLTLASPQVSRYQKSGKDAAEWLPDHNRCWYAHTVVQVKRKYRLSVDTSESRALYEVLARCTHTVMELPSGHAPAPVPRVLGPCGPFPNCAELRKVHPEGVRRGHCAYERRLDRNNDGHACQ